MRPLFPAILVLAITATPGICQKKAKSRKAHEHGSAHISIVVEGSTAVIEFEAPSMGVVGFEHVAKSAADWKKQDDALAKLKTSAGAMILFDSAAGCTFTPTKAEVVQEQGEEHSEVRAEFKVSCKSALPGTRIRFGVTKTFPAIEDVSVQVLNGAQQAGIDVEKDQGTIQLSR